MCNTLHTRIDTAWSRIVEVEETHRCEIRNVVIHLWSMRLLTFGCSHQMIYVHVTSVCFLHLSGIMGVWVLVCLRSSDCHRRLQPHRPLLHRRPPGFSSLTEGGFTETVPLKSKDQRVGTLGQMWACILIGGIYLPTKSNQWVLVHFPFSQGVELGSLPVLIHRYIQIYSTWAIPRRIFTYNWTEFLLTPLTRAQPCPSESSRH